MLRLPSSNWTRTSLAALLLAGSCLGVSGCSVIKLGVHRSLEEFSYRHTRKRLTHNAENWADECFWQMYGSAQCPPNEHYYDGFVAGFTQYVMLGDPAPPIVAPPKYRRVKFANPEGKQMTDSWFQGFHQGAIAGESQGYRQYIVLRAEPVAVTTLGPAMEPQGDIVVPQISVDPESLPPMPVPPSYNPEPATLPQPEPENIQPEPATTYQNSLSSPRRVSPGYDDPEAAARHDDGMHAAVPNPYRVGDSAPESRRPERLPREYTPRYSDELIESPPLRIQEADRSQQEGYPGRDARPPEHSLSPTPAEPDEPQGRSSFYPIRRSSAQEEFSAGDVDQADYLIRPNNMQRTTINSKPLDKEKLIRIKRSGPARPEVSTPDHNAAGIPADLESAFSEVKATSSDRRATPIAEWFDDSGVPPCPDDSLSMPAMGWSTVKEEEHAAHEHLPSSAIPETPAQRDARLQVTVPQHGR